MTLTPDQVKELKDQLKEQVNHLQGPQKEQALVQIESLSSEALEAMLKEQTSKPKQNSSSPATDKPIFRKIVNEEVDVYKIDENKESIAVLDIFPVSQGHIIIIPRHPAIKAGSIPQQALTLARKIAKRLTLKLKAKSVAIQTENKFGEEIINVIPSYNELVNINSPRTQAKKEDLESLKEKLQVRKRAAKQPKQIKKPEVRVQTFHLTRRVP